MTERNLFRIFTLNAAKIVRRNIDAPVKGADGNFRLTFRLNLAAEDNDVVQSQDDYADNALFWQILQVLPHPQQSGDALKYALVFVDFANVFSNSLSTADRKTTPSKQDLLADTSARVNELFTHGLELSFEGTPPKHFVAFDKSSSMARKCVISFLDAELKEILDKRLMLAMDLAGVPVVLSKYYAYRGLYLSTGLRINSFGEDDNALSLNEQSVIILPDFRTTITQDVLSAAKKGDFWKCVATTGKSLNLNSFDGEGLICPTWAARLNRQLKTPRPANSFQIRLPFTKGVLHAVDFAKFFRTEFLCAESLPVKDIFGIDRDLLKAKIILTASMFKCADWMTKWADRPADPMRYFFEQMNAFEHALWVCNTDANLHNAGKVSLNYQFLSTLDCTAAAVDSLVAEHVEMIKAVPQSVQNITQAARRQDSAEDNFADDFTAVKSDSVRNKCLTLLNRNAAFLSDPKVKSLIDMMQRDLEKALCLGQFFVQGEVRFLSCDLLDFLLRLARVAALDEDRIAALKTQVLRSEHFFMPEKILAMKCDKYYALLRSPHLSRNEQCLLRPFVKRGNLYDKYFAHLTGVVMVSCKSPVPAALGGADFDGDLVKVISDKRIVDAVKRGAYIELNRALVRKYPVIEIPSVKAVPQAIPPTIPFKVVLDTFANQVGRVSNLAVKFAQMEYAACVEAFAGKCAECTIVVGLEIDAAKNGVHPDKNIERLKSFDTAGSQFLATKNFFEKRIWTTFYNPHVVWSAEKGCFELYLLKRLIGKKKAALSVPITADGLASIELLPLRYMQYLHDKAQGKSADNPSMNKEMRHIHFRFEESKTWNEGLASDKISRLKNLIQAFVAVRRLARRTEQWRDWLSERKCDSFIDVELAIQYDSPDSILSCGVTVTEASEQMCVIVEDALPTVGAVERALKLMRQKQWHFRRLDRREELLAEILNCRASELPPAVVYLLTNFRDNGFMLLSYVLSNLKVKLEESADLDEFIAGKERLTDMFPRDNPFWQELYDEYLATANDKLSNAARDEQLASRCRAHVADIFGGDFDEALRYFWAVRSEDAARNFFWRVFTTQELLNNVCSKGGEYHAQ